MSQPLPSRLQSIDFLRGFAALAVVVYHAFEAIEPPSPPNWFHFARTILCQGYLGVPLFFVISGFCIHLPYARSLASHQVPTVGFTAFWKRRIHRLYPPYFIALCISMVMVVAVFKLGIPATLLDPYPQPRAQWIGMDFLAHIAMLHGVIPQLDQAGGNAVYWTLAREEYLYLMYFFLLAWRRKWGIGSAVAVTLVIGLSFYSALVPFFPEPSIWRPIIVSSAIVLWIQWCLGMLAVEAYYGLVTLPKCLSQLWLAALVGTLAKLSEMHLRIFAPVLFGFTFFILLNYCVRREAAQLFRQTATVRWLAGVGLFSYSLYLIHLPIQQVIRKLAVMFFPPLNMPAYILFCLVLTVSGYYGGKIFFQLVEKRVLNKKPAAIATTSVATAAAN